MVLPLLRAGLGTATVNATKPQTPSPPFPTQFSPHPCKAAVFFLKGISNGKSWDGAEDRQMPTGIGTNLLPQAEVASTRKGSVWEELSGPATA